MLFRQESVSMNYFDDEFDVILKDEIRNPGYKLLKTKNGGQDLIYWLLYNVLVQNALNNRKESRIRDENDRLNCQSQNGSIIDRIRDLFRQFIWYITW